MTTYTVYDHTGRAESGLTIADAMREIYTDDGAEFRLVPEMEENYDDEGNELPQTQESSGSKLIWRVEFKKSNDKWRASERLAFGADIEQAEEAFLHESYSETAYDASRWTIVTDEQYEREQADSAVSTE